MPAAALLLTVLRASASWTAYNDHAPGSGTSSNATTNNIRLQTSGPLKDIAAGTNLPVILSISTTGSGITFNNSGANPAAGTPMANAFNGFVFFGVGTDSNVEITNSTVTYTFTGLNPLMRYSFKGAANRGLTANAGSNRWTKVELSGAASFVDAHSQRVLTSTGAPIDLLTNQVAANFATNTVSGDIVDWEEIDPGPDGSFAVVCSHYQGFVPNGGHSNGTNGYAITGIRLEEVPSGPPVITTQPTDVTVTAGQAALFAVMAAGKSPLSYQWYRNGSTISGATSSNYTVATTSVIESGSKFSVLVSNSLGSITSSNATLTVVPVPIDFISVTNTLWKYDQSAANLGTGWKEVSYDDSAWPSGFGVLAWETDNQTVIPLTNTVLSLSNLVTGVRITTHYFRTHINIDDPNAYSITASNLIDDGVVIYVNGVEVHREDLPLPPTVIRFDTPATSALEAAWTGYPIASDYFASGDNVIAAEVHNVNAVSSDAVFGMRLQARELPVIAIAITNEPANLTVIEGATATLQVGFSGTRAQIQWYRFSGNVAVPVQGATRNPYILTNVLAGDAGFYFVVLSNALGIVSSDLVELTVIADLDPPELLTAQSLEQNTKITVSFSEPILAETATNRANYIVTNVTSGGTIVVVSASLMAGTNVDLVLAAPMDEKENYLVIVNGLEDTSYRHHPIPFNSAAPILHEISLVELLDPGWAFYNPVAGPPAEPFEPPPNWNQIGFQVPNNWGQNVAAIFAYNPNERSIPAPVNTSLASGAISSFYRFVFPFDGSPFDAQLLLRHVTAGGMIEYLNGQEITRFNLPSGTLTTSTPAVLRMGLALDSGLHNIAEFPIYTGTNVLAAEVHAHSTIDDLIAFGSELRARISSVARGPVIITAGPMNLTVTEGQSAQFTFVSAGASVCTWYTNGIPVPGRNASTFQIDQVKSALDGLVVSVAASNSESFALSTNALLHVIPDLGAPTLLSATAVSNGVLLVFNEPMDVSSLLLTQNYQLVDPTGGVTKAMTATPVGTGVIVSFGNAVSVTHRILVNGVRDNSPAQNEIACNTSATIGWDLVIPIQAEWRYNTNGTDLGVAWRNPSFAETTADWPIGAALIADETAGLPEIINTPISRLVNGNYHYTFYFRYHFYCPAGIYALPVTFQHIIDDGALMYINGQQFHNFNMSVNGDTVAYDTPAFVAIGDAVYNGPYATTFTNLTAGDNVIAVEVHQAGSASSDVAFGMELSAHLPSVVADAVDRLSVCQSGSDITLSWGGNSWKLEASDTLGTNAVWTPVAQHTNLFRATATGPQRFYRLRQ